MKAEVGGENEQTRGVQHHILEPAANQESSCLCNGQAQVQN